MKMLRAPPAAEVWIEVDESELQEPWMQEGFKMPIETKDGKKAYWWRVQGCWILVLPKTAAHQEASP
jgi:hypothetical protein